MTAQRAVSIRIAEVLRLTTALSDLILDAQIMKRPIPDDQVRALANAALLLEEYAIPLPPLTMQVLHEIGAAGLAAAVVQGEPQQVDGPKDQGEHKKAKGLAWLLRPFQERKG